MNVRRVFLILSILVTTGCGTAQTPLNRYVKQYKFTPFDLPRDHDGVGTVISFKGGHETIVASPDPPENQCLNEQNVPRANEIRVFPLEVEYTLTRASGLDLSLLKVLNTDADLAGAFADHRVRTVSIKLISPFERRITLFATEHYLKELSANDECRGVLTRDGNLIIHTVLGAKGVRYSFLGESSTTLAIDLTLLDAMKITPDLRQQYVGKAGLEVDMPILIGYRAWQPLYKPGFVEGAIELSDMKPSEVQKLRTASQKQ